MKETCGAHVPDEVEFATKPQLARGMLQRAMAAQVPAKWVAADDVYGSDSQWRRHYQLIAKQCHYKARGSPLKKVEL